MDALVRLVTETYEVSRNFYLDVYAENRAAIRAYEKYGFKSKSCGDEIKPGFKFQLGMQIAIRAGVWVHARTGRVCKLDRFPAIRSWTFATVVMVKTASIFIRASWLPKQKCAPPPNARWRFGLRETLNVSGFGNAAESRFAAPYSSPKSSAARKLLVANLNILCRSSDEKTAAAIRSGTSPGLQFALTKRLALQRLQRIAGI